jgi:mannitol 2-dehydrogenase
MTVKISTATVDTLPAHVLALQYCRSNLRPGILHFGVGNFHRAHMAVYLDELFKKGIDLNWAIVGASVRNEDRALRDNLRLQDWLTTVVEQENEFATARVTGPMVDYIEPKNTAAILDQLSDPNIRIVSLTITEGGYYIDPASGKFNAEHPDIQRDARHLSEPETVFGLILAGLIRRWDLGITPFTVMSCDNLAGNGNVTANAVRGLAAIVSEDMASWVTANVAFPNGMVDRITPTTSDRERRVLVEEFDVEDSCPVFCESFKQWVLEDHFPAGRPEIERVGVTFVDDVAPFEMMKIRILNGGHATLAYAAALLDIHFVHEAMGNPIVRGFLAKVEREEILPIVPPVPATDLSEYYQLIERRFANPRIGDTIPRLCYDGSNRQPKFILPSARDNLQKGASVTGLALVSALWARYCYGETDSGVSIAANDPAWDRLQAAAVQAKDRPVAFLAQNDIFRNLAQEPEYVSAFTRALESLWKNGTCETLVRYSADRL